MIAVAVALLAVAAILLVLLCLMAPYTIARRKAAPTLAPTRVALAVIAAAHLALALAASSAIYDVVDHFSEPEPASPSLAQRSDDCVALNVVLYGLVEPALLVVLGGIVRCKTTREPRPLARIGKWALAVVLPSLALQALLIGLQRVPAWSDALVLRPQPALPPRVDGGAPTYEWWHAEGCAVSLASLAGLGAVFIPFVVLWSLWCLRLRQLLVNLKIRRRLAMVHAAYALVPFALLVLRVSRLVWPARWVDVRRWVHAGEMALVFLSCGVIGCDLLWRPVRESPKVAAAAAREASRGSKASSDDAADGDAASVAVRSSTASVAEPPPDAHFARMHAHLGGWAEKPSPSEASEAMLSPRDEASGAPRGQRRGRLGDGGGASAESDDDSDGEDEPLDPRRNIVLEVGE